MHSGLAAINGPAESTASAIGLRDDALFRLDLIQASLQRVAARFDRINERLVSKRDPLDSLGVDHMVRGYDFVSDLIERKVELFEYGQSKLLLELNAIVLCGQDERVRSEAAAHLDATDKRFYDNTEGGIRDLTDWHALHATESPWSLAAGTYMRVLSEPELFIEGNHRTGTLIMSYVLGRAGCPPFVMTVENAQPLLDWSTRFCMKRKSGLWSQWQMARLRPGFADFLRQHSDRQYLAV